MSDPYLDPTSGILRNKFGLREQKALDAKEADVVFVRSNLLQSNPIEGNYDCEHLKGIHRYPFQDVYDWAGQFRTIPLAKLNEIGGTRITRFTPPERIQGELKTLFEQLSTDEYLKGLPRRQFAHKMAALSSEINRIHRFREGNGRAQRQFVRQLAQGVGYKLHFEVVSKERLVQASIESAGGDFAKMERLFDEITDTERIQPLKKVIEHLVKGGFNWNERYLATTTSGQNYAGKFAGRDATNFFFEDDQGRILVGNLKDLKDSVRPSERIEFTAS
jgi:cell filamentation protein